MTKQQAKKASKLQSHVTFHYAIRYEMCRVVYSIFLIAFSTLLMLGGYFYEYHLKESPTMSQFRIRLLIYLCYWLLSMIITGIVIIIIHYIIQFMGSLINRNKDDSERYLEFAYHELTKMVSKRKITESEMHLFFLNDALQSYGLNPYEGQFIESKKKNNKKKYNEDSYEDDEYQDEMEYEKANKKTKHKKSRNGGEDYTDDSTNYQEDYQTRRESNNRNEPTKTIRRGFGKYSR